MSVGLKDALGLTSDENLRPFFILINIHKRGSTNKQLWRHLIFL